MAMSENAKTIIKYLRSIDNADVTAEDIANATGLPKKTVNSCFTPLTREGKEFGVRVPAEIELDDGKTTTVKFLKLTAKGKTVDLDAE